MRKHFLTFEQVHVLRTGGYTDAYLSRKWKISLRTIHYARVGYTWKEHPTPPDTKPRRPGGRYAGPKAVREKPKRSWR